MWPERAEAAAAKWGGCNEVAALAPRPEIKPWNAALKSKLRRSCSHFLYITITVALRRTSVWRNPGLISCQRLSVCHLKRHPLVETSGSSYSRSTTERVTHTLPFSEPACYNQAAINVNSEKALACCTHLPPWQFTTRQARAVATDTQAEVTVKDKHALSKLSRLHSPPDISPLFVRSLGNKRSFCESAFLETFSASSEYNHKSWTWMTWAGVHWFSQQSKGVDSWWTGCSMCSLPLAPQQLGQTPAPLPLSSYSDGHVDKCLSSLHVPL